MTEVGIVVNHAPGRQLPTGQPSGVGGKTTYQVVLRDNAGPQERITKVGPEYGTPRAANRFANELEEERSRE